jgi:hypothetical protein
MKKFQYEITAYPVEKFTQLVYLCSDYGECKLNQLPSSQIDAFKAILDEKGGKGWEMVQVFFSPEGAVVIWKREI